MAAASLAATVLVACLGAIKPSSEPLEGGVSAEAGAADDVLVRAPSVVSDAAISDAALTDAAISDAAISDVDMAIDAATFSRCAGDTDAGPGPCLVDSSAVGRGACAGLILADAIELARSDGDAGWGALIDPYVSHPDGDGDFVAAYGLASGGFAIAFHHGWGDCPAGCISNEWWYFETEATDASACAVVEVGHSLSAYNDSSNSYVHVADGVMWPVPR